MLARTARGGGCPLCGATGAACGHPSASTPVDLFEEVAVVGGSLSLYEVTMPSGVVATLKLNAADAERMGGVPVGTSPGPTIAAVDEGPQPEPVADPRPKRAPRNKARASAANKEGGGGG